MLDFNLENSRSNISRLFTRPKASSVSEGIESPAEDKPVSKSYSGLFPTGQVLWAEPSVLCCLVHTWVIQWPLGIRHEWPQIP